MVLPQVFPGMPGHLLATGRLPECRITHEHRVACGNLVIVTYNLLIWVNAKEPESPVHNPEMTDVLTDTYSYQQRDTGNHWFCRPGQLRAGTNR